MQFNHTLAGLAASFDDMNLIGLCVLGLDDVEALVERERRRLLEGWRSLDPRGIKAIQPTHEAQVGRSRDIPSLAPQFHILNFIG